MSVDNRMVSLCYCLLAFRNDQHSVLVSKWLARHQNDHLWLTLKQNFRTCWTRYLVFLYLLTCYCTICLHNNLDLEQEISLYPLHHELLYILSFNYSLISVIFNFHFFPICFIFAYLGSKWAWLKRAWITDNTVMLYLFSNRTTVLPLYSDIWHRIEEEHTLPFRCRGILLWLTLIYTHCSLLLHFEWTIDYGVALTWWRISLMSADNVWMSYQ